MLYGYIRVSARDQNIQRQWEAMRAFPVPIKNIFVDKQSGKSFARPAWQRLLKKLRPGDVVVVHSIDRLGRNYEEILQQWRLLTCERTIDIVVMDFPLLDTRERKGSENGLTGRFLADLVLQILAYVAQQERENIHRRQAEGIACARARGVRFGPEGQKLPREFEKWYRAWQRGEIGMEEVIARCGLPRSTFYRLLHNWREQQALRAFRAAGKADEEPPP